MNMETLRLGSVALGDRLPELKIDITTGLIVGGAIASRDFTPVHHQTKAAQDVGLPDIFMNILTSNGLMARFVTDWAGPEAVVKSIDLRLGAPNVPGVVMTITGEVSAKDDAAATVDVAVTGENNVWGTHMSGIVRIELPKEA